jgi:hypothetical protein
MKLKGAHIADDSIDSGLEAETIERPATYIMIESRDRLEVTLTTEAIHVLNILHSSFTDPNQIMDTNTSSLINDVMPLSTVKLLSKAEVSV